jgi:hypothetical protein
MSKRKILEDLTTAPVPHSLGAAATPQPADVDEDVESKKKAEHGLLGQDGQAVDNEDAAYGVTYTLLDGDSKLEPVVWDYNAASEFARRMLALFGAKTLMTNEASGIRNNKKLPPDKRTPDKCRVAVVERFDLIASGKWADRTREAGAGIDKDAMAGAAVDYRLQEKKITAADVDSEYARIRAKFEDDAAYFKNVRSIPQVAALYAKRMGGPALTADDI